MLKIKYVWQLFLSLLFAQDVFASSWIDVSEKFTVSTSKPVFNRVNRSHIVYKQNAQHCV